MADQLDRLRAALADPAQIRNGADPPTEDEAQYSAAKERRFKSRGRHVPTSRASICVRQGVSSAR